MDTSATSTVDESSGVSSGSGINNARTQPAALSATESRRLAEYLPGPELPTTLEELTRADRRRRLADVSLSLMSGEDELKIALFVEE